MIISKQSKRKISGILVLFTALLNTSTTAFAFSLPTEPTNANRIELQSAVSSVPETSETTESVSLPQANSIIEFSTDPEPQTEPPAPIQEEPQTEPPIESTVKETLSKNLLPASKAVTAALPSSASGGTWSPRRVIQGVEWNSDVKNILYFSYARHIAAYDLHGNLIDQFDTDYYFTDMDYFEGHLFATWRNEETDDFGVYIFDAQDLSNYHYVSLSDVKRLLSEDRNKVSSSAVKGCIDGVTVAPAFGSQDDLKLYVSYGAWDDSSSELLCLRENQIILEYDLDDILSFSQSALAERIFTVDLGRVKFGIQSLEYDRDTGNIWCATRKVDNYSLFCLDKNSAGTTLSLIPNVDKTGWDCEAAGDGLCSLGSNAFYILVPTYEDNQITGTTYKITSDDFESFNK